jgi:hypothetical protein
MYPDAVMLLLFVMGLLGIWRAGWFLAGWRCIYLAVFEQGIAGAYKHAWLVGQTLLVHLVV